MLWNWRSTRMQQPCCLVDTAWGTSPDGAYWWLHAKPLTNTTKQVLVAYRPDRCHVIIVSKNTMVQLLVAFRTLILMWMWYALSRDTCSTTSTSPQTQPQPLMIDTAPHPQHMDVTKHRIHVLSVDGEHCMLVWGHNQCTIASFLIQVRLGVSSIFEILDQEARSVVVATWWWILLPIQSIQCLKKSSIDGNCYLVYLWALLVYKKMVLVILWPGSMTVWPS